MSSSSLASLFDVDLRPGAPPVLRAEAAGGALSWAAEHREALRAVVAEHGAVLVRGLGLRDAAGTGAVFRRLATGLMAEKEAFAARRAYADGVHSRKAYAGQREVLVAMADAVRLADCSPTVEVSAR